MAGAEAGVIQNDFARSLRSYREAIIPYVGDGAMGNKVKGVERLEQVQLPAMIKMAAMTELCPNDK
jgi:hypothetical protein